MFAIYNICNIKMCNFAKNKIVEQYTYNKHDKTF